MLLFVVKKRSGSLQSKASTAGGSDLNLEFLLSYHCTNLLNISSFYSLTLHLIKSQSILSPALVMCIPLFLEYVAPASLCPSPFYW